MMRRLSTIEPDNARLKRFQAKWTPVRVNKTRQIKKLEPHFDSIETEKARLSLQRTRFKFASLSASKVDRFDSRGVPFR
jgi:hypothetical protein